MVNKSVARYGVYPLPKGEVARIVAKVQVDLNEGLLQEVCRCIFVAKTLFKEAHQSFMVACEEVLEGVLVTLGG